MIDDVDADGIVLVQDVGNLQLGAYRVGAGHQNRPVIPLKFKKTTEEPDTAQDFRAEGRPGMFPNQLFSPGSSIDINPGSGIGFLNFSAPSVKNLT